MSELACYGHLQADIEPKGTKPVDDDEDIFGDAGTNYAPELPAPKAANGRAPAPTAGSYFEKKDEMTDLPALPKAGHFCYQNTSANACTLPSSTSVADADCAGLVYTARNHCGGDFGQSCLRVSASLYVRCEASTGAEPSGKTDGAAEEDMEIEEGEALPPPPPPAAPGADMGPACPPADYDAAAAYADPAAYEAYLQSSVAYQASRCMSQRGQLFTLSMQMLNALA